MQKQEEINDFGRVADQLRNQSTTQKHSTEVSLRNNTGNNVKNKPTSRFFETTKLFYWSLIVAIAGFIFVLMLMIYLKLTTSTDNQEGGHTMEKRVEVHTSHPQIQSRYNPQEWEMRAVQQARIYHRNQQYQNTSFGVTHPQVMPRVPTNIRQGVSTPESTQQYAVSGVNTEPTKTDNTRKVVIISDAILEMERQERKSKSEPLSKKEVINQNAPKNLQIDLDSQNNTAKLDQVAQKSEVESMGAELDSLPTLHELPESAILKAPSRYGYTLKIQAFNNVADAENKRQSATRVGVNATTVYQDGVYQVLVENIDTEDEALMLKQRLYEHSIASELVMP